MEEYDIAFYMRGASHTAMRFANQASSLEEAVSKAKTILEEQSFWPLNNVVWDVDHVVVSKWNGNVETGKTIYF